jgi:hypothetical protein
LVSVLKASQLSVHVVDLRKQVKNLIKITYQNSNFMTWGTLLPPNFNVSLFKINEQHEKLTIEHSDAEQKKSTRLLDEAVCVTYVELLALLALELTPVAAKLLTPELVEVCEVNEVARFVMGVTVAGVVATEALVLFVLAPGVDPASPKSIAS